MKHLARVPIYDWNLFLFRYRWLSLSLILIVTSPWFEWQVGSQCLFHCVRWVSGAKQNDICFITGFALWSLKLEYLNFKENFFYVKIFYHRIPGLEMWADSRVSENMTKDPVTLFCCIKICTLTDVTLFFKPLSATKFICKIMFKVL